MQLAEQGRRVAEVLQALREQHFVIRHVVIETVDTVPGQMFAGEQTRA